MVVGHEFVGEGVSVGSNVIDFHPGEIVSAEGHVVCGSCRNCLASRRHLCKATVGIGATDDKQFHVPLNAQTLACDKDHGIQVRPEHIHTALREFAGIVDHPLSKKFPLGVTAKDALQGLWG